MTGDWSAAADRSAARPRGGGLDEDGDVYGDFEDLETGEKFEGGRKTGDDGDGSEEEDEEDGASAGEGSDEEDEEERRRRRKSRRRRRS